MYVCIAAKNNITVCFGQLGNVLHNGCPVDLRSAILWPEPWRSVVRKIDAQAHLHKRLSTYVRSPVRRQRSGCAVHIGVGREEIQEIHSDQG